MKKYLILFVLIVWFTCPLLATHQRAGEITFRYISGLTYEITIVTYSYAPSPADRYELEIHWGDNTTSVLPRANGPTGQQGHTGEIVGQDIKKNLYTGVHTFTGAAIYKITVEDPNRNYGVQNIPNSVEVPLFIETELIISPGIGKNSSPQLLLPPIDQGCVDQQFIHNPGAYDPDGDSLSFHLVACRGAGGENIPGYQYPNKVGTNTTGSFSMNDTTGEILWKNPKMQGEYNISFLIEEWRHKKKIGYVTRDMQITIVTCDNHAPVISPIDDTCVEAGSSLQFKVMATDADNNAIKLTAVGAPLQITNPAVFTSLFDSVGHNTGIFNWETTCSHVRKNPYQVYFKATDNDKPVNLFDLKSINITVVGPAPRNLAAVALGNSIQLRWNKNRCSNVSGYKIYRRNGFYGYVAGHCETGVPLYTSYRLIATMNNTDTLFIDSELARGIDYCYMVVATYPDGAESYASNEACAQLKKDVPVITNISVQKTGTADGRIFLAWSKPTELDPVQTPGPYKYLIYRSDDLSGTVFNLLDSLTSLNDTTFTDDLINTSDHGLNYRIDLYNDTPGNYFLVGPTQKASSVFITLAPGDKKNRITINTIVPWTNEQFVIYRKNESTLLFDSIGTSILPAFTDNNCINGKLYCYKVKAIGTYGTAGITDPLINFSQEACAVPIDNEEPCAPILSVITYCDSFQNVLSWENINPDCSSDIAKYVIYYRPLQADKFVTLDSTQTLTYTHSSLNSLAGCYAVLAVDSTGNRGFASDTVCINSVVCGKYHLPNVFTPNRDLTNDLLIPFPYSGVESIDLQIFNRWGNLVFTTQDPDINWDGTIERTNQPVPDGVYYYVCDVYEITETGTVKRTIRGSITVIR
jgi:gliding motility-associated-like protein